MSPSRSAIRERGAGHVGKVGAGPNRRHALERGEHELGGHSGVVLGLANEEKLAA
jgi:hypothetical protein